ncbi:DNA recombination protein RmuC [Candidatus Nomurabacteria bacterium]|uniref:DNA recombination protein RmuC n=1 Tax=Candidatus Dojkabacteria bacterium TaxID=2099670 RepID=A0A955I1Z0_9BACT|nr:DNA recombination protein RmuC [Candidatus Dojkabacteria bacterium]MCB9790258.1 DNA recombination protein RmuC [Candidatus Nomurabacteria bacterium]MCB9803221.1 DNA recombination protein RmuC [Candidatus Nomurabacteria bacterium]
MEFAIGFILALGVMAVALFILKDKLFKQTEQQNEAAMRALELQLKSMLPDIMKQSNDMLVSRANEVLGAEKKEIKTDLENKRGEIERMIKLVQEDLKRSQKELSEAEQKRIGSFHELRERLENQQKVTEQLRVSTDQLKGLLSDNQMRGQFGEQIAEDLLRMTGFVRGIDYEFNKKQESSETRPDFSVFLPDGTRINVDAKFPYSNLQKMSESEDPSQKDKYLREFERDVKNKIKQVTSRDYINPDDQTVDFVILFIPNEMIFSFIYERFNDVWTEAMSNKVILAGPFSFTAILRMIRQAYESFRYQNNVRQIIGHIKQFEKEFESFTSEFIKIDKKISELKNQYDKVSGTRTNQLQKTVDKVRLEGVEYEDSGKQKSLLE